MIDYSPVYVKTLQNMGKKKIEQARQLMAQCKLCPRNCAVDRWEGNTGYCRAADKLIVASHGPHHGEETPLSGNRGSGTVFFSYCNLGCVFCQNYDISQTGYGKTYSVNELAEIFLELQARGCHNLNLVTPTHQMPMILEALEIATSRGLSIPLVWNCGGYESEDALEILEGIVDIYMPDFKFWDNEKARKYSNATDYADVAKKAMKIMHRQAGDLTMDKNGLAEKGILVRHLLMPGCLNDTLAIIDWLASEISKNTYLNLLDQYRPCYNANKYAEIDRRVSPSDYKKAVDYATRKGLRLDKGNYRKNIWKIFG
ncbi:MAG: radical SAM protein [Vulcanimicrobiota bacterium]